jgi:hypothetical protein
VGQGKIRGKQVTLLVTCLSMSIVALLVLPKFSSSTIELGEIPHVVDEAPLDFADAATREAVLWHLNETNTTGLLPFANACRDNVEMYRLTHRPGEGYGDFRVLDVRRSGRLVAIVEFGPRDSSNPSDDFWQQKIRRTVGEDRLASIRIALDDALRTKANVAVNDWIVDASRTMLETCRRGRYHFLSRTWSETSPMKSAGVEFDALARALLDLARRDPSP